MSMSRFPSLLRGAYWVIALTGGIPADSIGEVAIATLRTRSEIDSELE